MAGKCSKCDLKIKNKQYLTCSQCNCTYDLDCSGVPFGRFQLMKEENRKKWKCHECWEKYYDRIELDESINQTDTPNSRRDCNVTKRKKFVINVSTENSFSSLSEEDDLTTSINRSCPDIGQNNHYSFEEMQEKLKKLEEKLQSAELEIINLLTENSELQKKMKEYEFDIKKLRSICLTPKRDATFSKNINEKSALKSKKKSLKRRTLDFSTQEPNSSFSQSNVDQKTDSNGTPMESKHNKQQVLPDCQALPEKVQKHAHHNQRHDNFHKNNNLIIYKRQFQEDYENRKSLSLPKRKLIIVSDQRGKTLGMCLNDVYGEYLDIFCYTMPGSSTKELLRSARNLNLKLSKDDFIALITGVNDFNPNEIFCNLYYSVQELQNTNVLLSQIPYNRYLNTMPLNDMVKFIASQFVNADIIDCPNKYQNNMFLGNLAKSIIHKVACSLYNSTFITQMILQNVKKTIKSSTDKASMETERKARDGVVFDQLHTKKSEETEANKFFRRKSI